MPAASVCLPREHGAYGQIAFPLAAAFLVAGVSPAGLLLAVAVVASFLAHEPAAIVLGQRGRRARHELAEVASRWLVGCLVIAAAAAIFAALTMDSGARWTLAVPAVPAALLAVTMIRGREKSWCGETAAALAFSAVALPVTVAAGMAASAAWAVVIPFAVLFTTTTLAVRVVILRVRGGGDPQAVAATRRATLLISAVSLLLVAALVMTGHIPWWVTLAVAPGVLVAAAVVLRPPPPSRLRSIGWTLVAVSTLTAVIVIAAA